MNKKSVIITVFIFSMLSCGPLFAETASAERQTVFNDVTDYLATVGKDEQEKKEVLQERHDLRREARLKAEARRKRVETRKRMKAQEEAIMQKIGAGYNP